MELREFGNTGLSVTPIGFGAAQLGYLDIPQNEATRILNGVLDAGVGLIDTAACYPGSERLIGNAVADRRREFILATKCGHHVDADDPPDWDPKLIRKSVQRSLRDLKTDQLDIVMIHSCGVEALRNKEMVNELLRCKQDGLTRLVGYSGDNDAAMLAIDLGVFDCLETSLNICDQAGLDSWIPAAHKAGIGIMIKRPLANTAWRDLTAYSSMYAEYASVYTDRMKRMEISPDSVEFAGSWLQMALRFTAWQPGVSTILIGGKNAGHIKENIQILEEGPLPDDVVTNIREAWREYADTTWVGQT